MKKLIAVASIVLAATSAALAETKKVFHIGNSVTDTINYTGLGQLVSSRGDVYTMGRHMIPGSPLAWIYSRGIDGNNDGVANDPTGFTEAAFGPYNTALANFSWDAVTLQPFDRQLGTPTGLLQAFPDVSGSNDVPVIREFMKILRSNSATTNNTNTKVYVYQRWPRRPQVGGVPQTINYPQQWNRTYTGGWDGTEETRDYFNQVLASSRTVATNLAAADGKPANPVFIVPVGDVMAELDVRIKANQIPGFTDITQLYADGIHLTNVGGYLVGLTFYATLYGKDPNGLPVANAYATPLPISAPLAAALQDVVWDVVLANPNTGVIPEPGSSLLLISAGALALLRPAK